MLKATVAECCTNPNKDKEQFSISEDVISMTFDEFASCFEILMEQIFSVLHDAFSIEIFIKEEGLVFYDDPSSFENSTNNFFASASELAQKSMTELLRLRKDAHSLLTLDEIKRLWDLCLLFCSQLEKCSSKTSCSNTSITKVYTFKNTPLGKLKAFWSANMSKICRNWLEV